MKRLLVISLMFSVIVFFAACENKKKEDIDNSDNDGFLVDSDVTDDENNDLSVSDNDPDDNSDSTVDPDDTNTDDESDSDIFSDDMTDDSNDEDAEVPDEAAPMVDVAEGEFDMGCNSSIDEECFEDEKPYHTVSVSGFKIDKYEVTVKDYRKCISAGACTNKDSQTPHFKSYGSDDSCNLGADGKEMHPMNCVSWYGAKAYCEWLEKRLPTEAEWEKAARGTDGRIYPWGNSDLSCGKAVINDGCGAGTTMPVGSKPDGASPYGAQDMVGNVWEWVYDWYDEYYFASSPEENPEGPEDGEYKVLKGGSWLDNYDKTSDRRASMRSKHYPVLMQAARGFRCAE